MPKYEVVKPFIYLGKSLKVGVVVELTAQSAKYLELAGKVKRWEVKPTKKKRVSKRRGTGKTVK